MPYQVLPSLTVVKKCDLGFFLPCEIVDCLLTYFVHCLAIKDNWDSCLKREQRLGLGLLFSKPLWRDKD